MLSKTMQYNNSINNYEGGLVSSNRTGGCIVPLRASLPS